MITNNQLPFYLNVNCMPVPVNPFYVRWLNRFGGLDYWMFSQSQELHRKQDNYTSFSPYIENYADATGTEYNVDKTVSETIKVGAGMLSAEEWGEISRIAYSPLVQWYNEKTQTWLNVLVKEADVVLITDKNRDAEITFQLPQPQLQF